MGAIKVCSGNERRGRHSAEATLRRRRVEKEEKGEKEEKDEKEEEVEKEEREGGTIFSTSLLFKLSKPQIKKGCEEGEGERWEGSRKLRRRIWTNLLFKLSQPPTLSRPRKSKQEDPPTMIRT